MSNSSPVEITTQCKKCPEIEGNTWCAHKKCQIWKEDEMCEHGYLARIERGIEMCSEEYEDRERFDKIMAQVTELENLWQGQTGNNKRSWA
jgi:hypothetical protein